MIRKWDTKDTAPLLALWLDSTIHAHPFISESYWRDSVAVVLYLHADSEDTPKELYAKMGFQAVDKLYEYLCTDFSKLKI